MKLHFFFWMRKARGILCSLVWYYRANLLNRIYCEKQEYVKKGKTMAMCYDVNACLSCYWLDLHKMVKYRKKYSCYLLLSKIMHGVFKFYHVYVHLSFLINDCLHTLPLFAHIVFYCLQVMNNLVSGYFFLFWKKHVV